MVCDTMPEANGDRTAEGEKEPSKVATVESTGDDSSDDDFGEDDKEGEESQPIDKKALFRKSGKKSTRGVQRSTVVAKHSSSDFLGRHYEQIRELGRGGYGTVSLVKDCMSEEERVCKVVSTKGMAPEVLEMMKQEVELLCHLDHPYIVKIYEYAVDDSREELVFILEHLSGGDCRQLQRNTPGLLSEALVARLLNQVLLALAYCHAQGVLHRDIKPENILLLEEEMLGMADCKVIDFGVSTRHGDKSQETGAVWGTPAYLPPEVVCKRGGFSPKADVWACGITAFKMLTGRMPFGDSDEDTGDKLTVLRSIAGYQGFGDIEKAVADNESWLERSDEAKQFVRSLLTADPEQRPTAVEVLDHPWLQQYCAEDEGLTQEMLDGIAQYSKAPKLVHCCLYAIAARLDVQEAERFGQGFLSCDRRHAGTILPEDLKEALRNHPNVDPQVFFDSVDLDHSGDISHTEFVSACLYSKFIRSGSMEELLTCAFEAIDEDRDGKVKVADIRGLFRERDGVVLDLLPQDEPFGLPEWRACLMPAAEQALDAAEAATATEQGTPNRPTGGGPEPVPPLGKFSPPPRTPNSSAPTLATESDRLTPPAPARPQPRPLDMQQVQAKVVECHPSGGQKPVAVAPGTPGNSLPRWAQAGLKIAKIATAAPRLQQQLQQQQQRQQEATRLLPRVGSALLAGSVRAPLVQAKAPGAAAASVRPMSPIPSPRQSTAMRQRLGVPPIATAGLGPPTSPRGVVQPGASPSSPMRMRPAVVSTGAPASPRQAVSSPVLSPRGTLAMGDGGATGRDLSPGAVVVRRPRMGTGGEAIRAVGREGGSSSTGVEQLSPRGFNVPRHRSV